MKQKFNTCLVVLLFALSVGIAEAQKANPPSDFEYDLNKEGTGVIIEKYKGKATDVIIPSVIEDFPVVTLGNQAFLESSIVSVVIPDSVTDIYGGAFESCKSLQKVTLPKNLVYIGRKCFAYCSLLKEITLPEGLKKIYEEAFKYSGLESITIPNSILIIDCEAFQECKNLKTVNIGNGIKAIVNRAFKNCSSLTTFNICVENFSSRAFVKIYDDYYNSGYADDVFNGCSSLSLKERKKIRDTGYKGGF